jgi:hypothetical protein
LLHIGKHVTASSRPVEKTAASTAIFRKAGRFSRSIGNVVVSSPARWRETSRYFISRMAGLAFSIVMVVSTTPGDE